MIRDINYNKMVESILPPNKRTVNTTLWNVAMSDEVQLLNDNLTKIYVSGDLQTDWVAGSYSIGDIVRYGNSIFQSNYDLNVDVPNTQSDKWNLVSSIFIGLDERVKFDGSKIKLEYALNLFFGSVFRQPPLTSDIYILKNVQLLETFLVGNVEYRSSSVGDATSSEFITDNYVLPTTFYNITIMVPLSVFNGLSIDPNESESIIRNYANKYINSGILYNVLTY